MAGVSTKSWRPLKLFWRLPIYNDGYDYACFDPVLGELTCKTCFYQVYGKKLMQKHINRFHKVHQIPPEQIRPMTTGITSPTSQLRAEPVTEPETEINQEAQIPTLPVPSGLTREQKLQTKSPQNPQKIPSLKKISLIFFLNSSKFQIIFLKMGCPALRVWVAFKKNFLKNSKTNSKKFQKKKIQKNSKKKNPIKNI
jgi:hypothetical protein